MDDARRKRPWWHWALVAFAGLLILSAIFGEEEKEHAQEARTVTLASPVPPGTIAAVPVSAVIAARAAVDEGHYAEAVSIAAENSEADRYAIALRIANRIARRALTAVRAGDLDRARARLKQADRFPATTLSRRARASYRAARRRAAATARQLRQAQARRRRAAAAARAARDEATEQQSPASCDPSYEGACLNPASPDYDCAGGSGNGPDYTGTVRVVGTDHFDLDRDGDGVGCQP